MSHARFCYRDLIYADELALIGDDDDDNPVSQTDSGTGGIRKIEKDCEVELYDRSYSSFGCFECFLSRIYLLGGKRNLLYRPEIEQAFIIKF